ncbi:glycosyltransferase, partial [Bacillus sp. JJ1122]
MLKQTYKNIEIICINDGSTDRSKEILDKYLDEYNNLTVINQQNQGLSGARNTGIMHSSGDYIYFLDSDDFLSDNTVLECMLKEASKEDLDIIFGSYKYYFDDNARENKIYGMASDITNNVTMSGIEMLEAGIKSNTLNSVVWNKLYKSTLVRNENFIENVYFEDMEYTIRIFKKAKGVRKIDILTVNYRQRHNSIMSGNKYYKKAIDYISVAKAILDIDKNNPYILSWIVLCIFNALKFSKKLKGEQKKEVIFKIYSIPNLPFYFLKSFSIKHKLYGIYM